MGYQTVANLASNEPKPLFFLHISQTTSTRRLHQTMHRKSQRYGNLLRARKKTAFILKPNTIHGCLSLTGSCHTSIRIWGLPHWSTSQHLISWGINWIGKHLGADHTNDELLFEIDKITDELEMWKKLSRSNTSYDVTDTSQILLQITSLQKETENLQCCLQNFRTIHSSLVVKNSDS